MSAVGFGGWAIGGPATANGVAIGWGPSDDATSVAAIARAADTGITLFDTADFYAFGHSEDLIGRVLGNRADVVIATKVGQRLGADGAIVHDYSTAHIIAACEASLRRLRRDAIDFYQLHTARLPHLEEGACIEAMEQLRAQGKIRYWGVSLATLRPVPEAEFLLGRRLGHGVQLVLNVLNQRAVPLLGRLRAAGYGVIARMPFQFGLLTGRVTRETRFPADDHRAGRLAPPLLDAALPVLQQEIWPIAERCGLSRAGLALAFAAGFPEVSSVIPGIRTPAQAAANAELPTHLPADVHHALRRLGTESPLQDLMAAIERQG